MEVYFPIKERTQVIVREGRRGTIMMMVIDISLLVGTGRHSCT